MKRASIAWDEVIKWGIFLLLLIVLIIIIVLFFKGGSGVWESIKNVLTLGAG